MRWLFAGKICESVYRVFHSAKYQVIWLKHKISLLPTPLRWLGVLLLASSIVLPAPIHAQVLRVGPFDFFAVSKLEAVYTTNVERERKSEAQGKMEDYFIIAALELASTAELSYSTTLTLDTGFAAEKHFIRDDLDNSTAPFGRLRLASKTELSTLTLNAGYSWERASESSPNVIIPGGRSSKTRNPQTRIDYNLGLDWKGGPFRASASYEFASKRHQKEQFKDLDEDRTTYLWGLGWRIMENLAAGYENERRLTERVSIPDDDAEWQTTERITIDWRLQFLRRPQMTYTLGIEKEDTQDKKGEWETLHEISAREEIEFNSRLRLSMQASYTYEENPEADDIRFSYGAQLSHEISYSAKQTLAASREPKETLGSTLETDTTNFRYNFSKTDLFMPNLSFLFGAGYQLTKPVDGPEEKILTYDLRLFHEAAYTRRLVRTLAYDYSFENSNLIEENLVEHRVTWSYEYTF